MAQPNFESYPREQTTEQPMREVNPWAVGFIFFAACMMTLIGTFHFIEGFAALINGDFIVVRPGYDLGVDVTTWAWAHMIGGTILFLAGLFLFTGSMLARIITVGAALISALGSFYSIPYYPVWSIITLVMAIIVIWAVVAHGREMEIE